MKRYLSEDQFLGYVWVHCESDGGQIPDWWAKHRIRRITKKKVFIDRHPTSDDPITPVDPDDDVGQYALDRDELERDGNACAQGKWYRLFYSDEGKRAYEAAHPFACQPRRSVGPKEPECAKVLGLTVPFFKEDVVKAFRKAAHEHHPDKGGDPDMFRKLVEAKDAALQIANF
jgi:hypothetical protein